MNADTQNENVPGSFRLDDFGNRVSSGRGEAGGDARGRSLASKPRSGFYGVAIGKSHRLSHSRFA